MTLCHNNISHASCQALCFASVRSKDALTSCCGMLVLTCGVGAAQRLGAQGQYYSFDQGPVCMLLMPCTAVSCADLFIAASCLLLLSSLHYLSGKVCKVPVVDTPCAGACPALNAAVVMWQVHFLQISTEEDFSPGSPQWT